MTFSLDALPYDKNALSPHVSSQTLDVHHGKHHNAYVQKLNKLIEGTELSYKTLEEIILATYNDDTRSGIFNNAAQVWNHSFLWNSMTPNKINPSQTLLDNINKSFGSYDKFSEKFKTAGLTQFGSGWVWLVFDPNTKKLKIVKTGNAANPITQKLIPILTCDVWEHAYYLDYKNDRGAYLDTFLNHLISWTFAEKNFKNI
jgi:Fe-Mn family superoxide dismutase